MQRPSGASIQRAWFKSGGDAVAQQGRWMRNFPGIAAEILDTNSASGQYTVAAGAHQRVNTDGLVAAYRKLWSLDATTLRQDRDSPYCDVETYLKYVRTRAEAVPHLPCVWAALNDATLLVHNVRTPTMRAVHGDATTSNAVTHHDGTVRLIDFSVSPTVPDPAIDQAKLIFSYFGFDHDDSRGLPQLLQLLGLGNEIVPLKYAGDVRFYFLTHIVRVGSREPEREEFLERAYSYACL